MGARSRLLMIGLALAALTLWAAPGSARKPQRPSLRAEIARLRGEIAQLGSHVDFTNRRLDAAPIGGGSLCADPCATDSDGDGTNDCEDLCPCDPDQSDRDGDGVPDCADPCPDDATDACIDPCRMDSDSDGVTDCADPCPYDPAAATDSDGDGTPDCQDPCPQDPGNECFDPCVLDQDGDGTPDCRDGCPWVGQVSETGSTVFCAPPPTLAH